jgi:hypothetical protein
MPMRNREEQRLEDLSNALGHRQVPRPATGWSANLLAPPDVPSWETIQSALHGAIRFAQILLGATGTVDVAVSRVICTPDARHWTLAFGEHYFLVEVVGDGFSVRSFRHSVPVFAA